MRSFVLAVLLLLTGAWAAEDGTKANPLTISSVQDLLDFRTAVQRGTEYKGVTVSNMGAGLFFKQTADLDLSSVCGRDVGSWDAIGPFAGSYDGGGHKISNMFVDEEVDSPLTPALFGPILADEGDTTYFENIVIEKAYFHTSSIFGAVLSQVVSGTVVVRNNTVDLEYKSGARSDGSQVGGIVGNAVSGWVGFYNNTVKGSFQVSSGDGHYVGGVIGIFVSDGSLVGNTNEAKFIVKGIKNPTVGGIAAQMLSSTEVKGNTNKGNILMESSVDYPFAGGIIGVAAVKGYPSTVVGNVNYGKIEFTGNRAYLGGVLGLVQGDSTLVLDSCVNQGEIAYHGAGGLTSRLRLLRKLLRKVC